MDCLIGPGGVCRPAKESETPTSHTRWLRWLTERAWRPWVGTLDQIPRHPDLHQVSWSTLG